MKKDKIIYWVSTGIMCFIFLFSAQIYFFNYDMVTQFFKSLNFPVWLVYPLAIAKVFGVIIVLINRPILLKELAYAGFFYNSLLALTSHLIAKDGGYFLSLFALIATIVSRIYNPLVTKK